jgi:tetratricopeptide (TPR) repeat protein
MWTRSGMGARNLLGLVALLAVVFAGACKPRKQEQAAQKAAPKPEEACDAEGWCVQQRPNPEKREQAFCSVWAASANDVWAVGNSIARWDGVRWTEMEGTARGTEPGRCWLNAVHGSGPNAVWAVGGGASLFWDGKKLTEHPLPMGGQDVFVTAPDEAWVVDGTAAILRWDGRQWAPSRPGGKGDVQHIYCAKKDDCWAAGTPGGMHGDVEPNASITMLHWEGRAWQDVTVRMPGAHALSGTASDDVWAVGPWGRIFHYDGRTWAPSPSHARRTLYDVHAAARDDVWALGDDGLVLHFDGKQWSAAKPTWPRLTSVSAAPSRDVWALNFKTILHWRSATFRPKAALSKDLWDEGKLTPSEQQQQRALLATYTKSLAAGRSATKAANYEAAARAFTAALDAQPDDPRALAERGYAAYRAGKLDDADRDLARAAELAEERVLRAQVFFNLGLVREARGEDAISAFALANALRPSEAAKKRLAGKSACAVEIERDPKAIDSKVYRDWLAFHADVEGELQLEGKPRTSDEARKILCDATPESCNGKGPWFITDHSRRDFLVHESKQGLAVATVATADALGMCPLGVNAEIVHRAGDTIVVRAHGGSGYGVTLCDSSAGELDHECTSEELEAIANDSGSQNWMKGCNWRSHTKYEVLDLQALTARLIVTEYDDMHAGRKEAEQTRISVDARGVVITGPGCSEVLPLN